MEASQIESELVRVLHTKEEVAERLRELAAEIDAEYGDKNLLLIGVLNGAVMVMAVTCTARETDGPDGVR